MTSPALLPRPMPRRRPIAFATLAALLLVLPVAAGCSKDTSSEAPAAGPAPNVGAAEGGFGGFGGFGGLTLALPISTGGEELAMPGMLWCSATQNRW